MKRFQFTLGQFAVLVAIVAIVLAMPAPTVGTVVTLLLVLVLPALVISQLPYRVRLTVEAWILFLLILLRVWSWQSHFYVNKADEAAQLAWSISDWEAMSKNPRARAILRREAAWFSRRAATLRLKAIWVGLIHGPTYPSGRRSREENRRLLDMLWEMKRHKDAARLAHESSFPGSRGP